LLKEKQWCQRGVKRAAFLSRKEDECFFVLGNLFMGKKKERGICSRKGEKTGTSEEEKGLMF